MGSIISKRLVSFYSEAKKERRVKERKKEKYDTTRHDATQRVKLVPATVPPPPLSVVVSIDDTQWRVRERDRVLHYMYVVMKGW